MAAASSSRCRVRLPALLCAGFCSWACLWFLALPALAVADPYSPPGIGSIEPSLPSTECSPAPASSESEDAVVVELRELRRELAADCTAMDGRLDALAHRSWWVVAELATLRESLSGVATDASVSTLSGDLQTLHSDLTAEGGVPVLVEGQGGSIDVGVPAGVEVTNPPDLEGVQAAVVDGSETNNQNLWAIAGLFVGFGLLAVLYKLVRP